MLKNIAQSIIDYYHFIILPFLSISIFYAMEYMNHGADFFVNEKGVKWRFLTACALMQFFVSLVVIISVIAIFRSETLKEYETFRMIAIILLGTTPFNISILIWVAIKLEIYRLMKNRYKNDLNDFEKTKSLLSETLGNNYKSQHAMSETSKEEMFHFTQHDRIDTQHGTKEAKQHNKGQHDSSRDVSTLSQHDDLTRPSEQSEETQHDVETEQNNNKETKHDDASKNNTEKAEKEASQNQTQNKPLPTENAQKQEKDNEKKL